MIDLKMVLKNWSQKLIHLPENTGKIPEEMVESRWLGYPGATEAELDQNERRIGKSLPKSYREFLRITNGFLDFGNSTGEIWPVQKIGYFAQEHNADYIEPWLKGYYFYGRPNHIADEVYLKYGDENNLFSTLLREEYLLKTIQISELGDSSAVYLLNPEIVDPDGEWEAWYFEPELGLRRYQSFIHLIEGEYKWFLRSNGIL